MKEIKDIINSYNNISPKGTKCAIATVVHVEGSSYRRASARMLVDEYGNMTGAISGGCLEGDALRKALHSIVQEKKTLVSYDTSDEDDAVIGAQLGCNGIIKVLFEPVIQNNKTNPIEILKKATNKKQNGVLITIFNLNEITGIQIGTSFYISENQETYGSDLSEDLKNQILKDAKNVFEKKTSLFREYKTKNETFNVFLEWCTPPINLIVVGAGNDAKPIVKFAEILGWDVLVIDGRPTHANTNRFESGCQIMVSKPDEALSKLEIKENFAFILMTHNYHYDFTILKWLIKNKYKNYIGILGPLKKFDKMVDDLKMEGINLTDEQRKTIFSPMGLEIGAEIAEEIALSVLAEIKMFLSKLDGTSLKNKKSPIHSRENEKFLSIEL